MEEDKFCALMDEMTASMSSVRQVIKSISEKAENFDAQAGISLLSVKHHALLSYLNSLVLLSCHRVTGHTLTTRTPPSQPFSSMERDQRGSGAGDLVDSMVEMRIVLEKIKTLETRMQYQIQKLVKLAKEPEGKTGDILNDPLAFRPNPQNLMNPNQNEDSGAGAGQDDRELEDDFDPTASASGEIYRPPRLAPVPYPSATSKSKAQQRKERPPVPSALATLATDLSRPHMETTSGLGGAPSLESGRARYLKRLNEYEEENFTRLVMKKREAKQRERDEADLALGGTLGGGGNARGRRRAGGLEDEFGDVLRSVERGGGETRRGATVVGDGYEELRMRGKKKSVLERSRDVGGRKRGGDAGDDDGEVSGERPRKKSRFDQAAKAAKRRLKKSSRGSG